MKTIMLALASALQFVINFRNTNEQLKEQIRLRDETIANRDETIKSLSEQLEAENLDDEALIAARNEASQAMDRAKQEAEDAKQELASALEGYDEAQRKATELLHSISEDGNVPIIIENDNVTKPTRAEGKHDVSFEAVSTGEEGMVFSLSCTNTSDKQVDRVRKLAEAAFAAADKQSQTQAGATDSDEASEIRNSNVTTVAKLTIDDKVESEKSLSKLGPKVAADIAATRQLAATTEQQGAALGVTVD